MAFVRKLVLEDSFDAMGTLIHEGDVGTFDTARLSGNEKHLVDVGKNHAPDIIQMAPIGPTGPNPTAPSQIPPDARQTAGGAYTQPGAVLVGEVTTGADVRLAAVENDGSGQAEIAQLMAEHRGEDTDVATNGTVAEITADLGGRTDAELAAIRAIEVGRDSPRKGVLSAIDAETASRAG